jgi:hypothetical protein
MRALGDRFIAIVLALGLIAASMTGARADPYGDALLAFTADNFDQSGNPAANGGLCQQRRCHYPRLYTRIATTVATQCSRVSRARIRFRVHPHTFHVTGFSMG